MKKLISLTLVLLMLVSLYPCAQAAAFRTTIMMYMCGTDLQSDCVIDMYEMCEATYGDNIRIVVLAGGASEWDDEDLRPNRLNYFTIQDGGFSRVEDWGKSSMGSSATLEKFISTAYRAYPADRYMLVLWNHGGGSADGVCFDEVHNDDSLTLQEINDALYNVRQKDRNFHLSLMGCDACLMGSYEMAVLASNYADYYIASEELEPWTGWYYTPWLNALDRNPGMSNAELGKAIVDAYAKGVREEGAQEYTTLSLIDCNALSDLNADMEKLSAFLGDALENGQLATIRRSLSRMYRYGSYDSSDGTWDMYDLGDLLDLCEQFAPNTVKDARRHLEKAVAYSYASKDMPAASGLSIYVPNKSSSYFFSDILEGYDLSAYIPNYVDFAAGLSTMLSGGNYSFQAAAPAAADVSDAGSTLFSFGSGIFSFIPGGSYNAESASQRQDSGSTFIPGSSNPAGAAAPAAAESSFAFSLSLPRDAMNHLDYAEGALFMDLSDEEGIYLLDLGYMQNSWIDWNGSTVYSTFDGTWPTLGEQLVVMYDQSKNPAARRSLIPVLVNDEETYLVVSFPGESSVGTILGYNDGVDDNGLPIRRITPLEYGDEIVPLYTLYYSDWDDDSEMEEMTFEGTPFYWEDGMEVIYESLEDEDEPTDYQFAFYLNDIFGEFEMSDFFTFTM